MLKRQGQICQYRVPGFAGRLNETEYGAYSEAVIFVQDELKYLSDASLALADLEQQLPNWTGFNINGSVENAKQVVVQGDVGKPWQILRTISKSSRNEVLFCGRKAVHDEFAIVERFDPTSAYARRHGNTEVLMKGNDPRLLLQDHLENERAILELFRRNIEATVQQLLTENYPGENVNRVVKAVGVRCSCNRSTARSSPRAETRSRNIRIRF